ncbi:MAG: hypothetical protein K0S65_4238 [Labilithrix sp.]|nr:hypothetical protein [Labilithrix sp.]
MVKRSSLVALFLLVGCSGSGSVGDPTSSRSPLETSGSKGGNPAASSENAAEEAQPGTSIDVNDIEFIEVDELQAPVPRMIRVEASCRLTDHTGLDAVVDAARCTELFEYAVDPTDPATYGCGDSGGVGTVRVHLKDGSDLVRELAADRCSVTIPALPADKMVYAAWQSVGGDFNATSAKD